MLQFPNKLSFLNQLKLAVETVYMQKNPDDLIQLVQFQVSVMKALDEEHVIGTKAMTS